MLPIDSKAEATVLIEVMMGKVNCQNEWLLAGRI